MRTHLFELAGDAYEGRGAGYPGERRACDYGALKVSGLLPGFPADRAGLQVGDLIVGVDGEPFSADTSLHAPKTLRERLLTGGPHVLDVQRDGVSVRIEMGPR